MVTGRLPRETSVPAQSWFDALTDWIDRGPKRRYAVYLAIFAASAHDELRDLLDLTPGDVARWRTLVTTTPAGSTLAFGLVGGAVAASLLLPLAQRPELGLFDSAIAAAAHGVLLGLTCFVIATYMRRAAYRSSRSRRLHHEHLRVDLLRPGPLFSQTGVIARGGATLVAYSVLWILTAPGAFEHPGFIVMAIVVNAIAVILWLIQRTLQGWL